VLAAAFPQLGIGFVGVSLAFGLTVLDHAYAVGGISGGHFNPRGVAGPGRRRPVRLEGPDSYWIAQVVGAVAAAAVLFAIASGKPGFEPGGFASNGYGDLSPGLYGLHAALLVEWC
jgi:aquaporin Z